MLIVTITKNLCRFIVPSRVDFVVWRKISDVNAKLAEMLQTNCVLLKFIIQTVLVELTERFDQYPTEWTSR